MARCATDLSSRSDGAELPPWDGAVAHRGLLDADAAEGTWRIVEAFSTSDLPFELDVRWTSGSGSGAKALVTVARAARLCVFARGLQVRAGNLADVANRVGVNVADGWTVTENTWEVTGFGGDLPVDIPVPPFAKRVRIELEDPARVPIALVHLYNGRDELRSTFVVGDQPPDGVPVGGARRLTVTVGNGTGFRAVFTLSL